MYHGHLSEYHYSCEVSLFYTRQPGELNRAHKDKVAAHTHQMAILGLKELQTSRTVDCKYDLGMVDPSSKEMVIGQNNMQRLSRQWPACMGERVSLIRPCILIPHLDVLSPSLHSLQKCTICLHNIYEASAQPALRLRVCLSLTGTVL